MTLIVALLAGFVTFLNGANDNFKGVCTLYGSGVTSYSSALALSSFATFIGSLTSMFLPWHLLRLFSGASIFQETTRSEPYPFLAILLGAAIVLYIATILGMPTSTTHALTGGLFGVAIAANSVVPWATMVKMFLVPLLFSPFIAATMAMLLHRLFSRIQAATGIKKETCLCLHDGSYIPVPSGINLAPTSLISQPRFMVATQSQCVERYTTQFFGITVQDILDHLHRFSAMTVSFARGLNDTPKLAAFLLMVTAFNVKTTISITALAILVGGILSTSKVAKTLSHRITPMTPGQGCTANLTTSFLVILASFTGLPVSTTHVSVGALFGIGLHRKGLILSTLYKILGTWLFTMPGAALLGYGLYRWFS